MVVDAISGVNAYQQAIKTASSGGSAAQSFSDMVNQTIDESMISVKNAEKMGLRATTGEVSVEELTTAISEAELSLRTMVAIRDKIVSAYQEISKMPI